MEPQLQKVSFCEVCKGLLVLLHSFQFICQVLEGDKSIAASQENFSNIINPSRTHDYYNSSVTFCRSLSSTCCKQFTPPFLCRKFVCSSLSNSPLGLCKEEFRTLYRSYFKSIYRQNIHDRRQSIVLGLIQESSEFRYWFCTQSKCNLVSILT